MSSSTGIGSGAPLRQLETAGRPNPDKGNALPSSLKNSQGPVTVQLASFKSQEKAEKVKRDAYKRLRGKEIRKKVFVLRQGNFYKTRIGGFETRDEARALLEGLGIKNYFFVAAHAQ